MAAIKFSQLPSSGVLSGDEELVGIKPSGSESDFEDVLVSVNELAQFVLSQDSNAGGGGASDAVDLTYTPTTAADWDGGADPGDAQEAFDQLAERVKDLEGSISSGTVVQVKNFQTGAVSSGANVIIPLDDTIPQNTEGTEYMSLSITPTSATNKLKIDVVINVASVTTAPFYMTAALFQDSTANALAAQGGSNSTSGHARPVVFTHYMTAGTTSSTTFKVRAGSNAGTGTNTFNGIAGGRLLGGVMASSITITEIVP